MPLVIRELVIRALVRDEGEGDIPDPSSSEGDVQSIISQCVDQVLEILERREER